MNNLGTANMNTAISNPFGMNAAQMADGMKLMLTATIMGQYFNALNASPFAGGMFPTLFNVSGFCGLPPQTGCFPTLPQIDPAQQWTAEMTGAGRANVDLGDGYTLQFNEKSSEIYILNDSTGEKTRIWGDPHVDVDGKRAFDFWGTTTFTLENGTKITINTEQWKGNPNMYVASQVVVTKGSNALVVDGISQNQLGDLKLTMSNNGEALDAAHRDGYVLHENEAGSGWNSELTGELATQQDMNATKPGGVYGPGSELPSLGEIGQFMGGFLLFGMAMQLAETINNDRAQERFTPRLPIA